MSVYLFPGQGSQVLGMGEGLFERYSHLVDKANEILMYSLPELCLNDNQQKLNETQFTQPALYMVSALAYLEYIENNPQPNYLAGHSLGEYAALFAAGVFDFETGLRLTQKRGALMAQAPEGAMLAVIGLQKNKIQNLIEQHQKNFSRVYIANDNSYQQLLLSGDKQEILNFMPVLQEAGAKTILLKTSGAFHSPYMKNAQLEYAQFLKSFSFSAPKIPVIANVNVEAYSVDTVNQNLIQQIVEPVRWKETMEYFLNKGEEEFIEIGPGKVLTKLLQRIKQGQ